MIHVENLADALALAGQVPDKRILPYMLADHNLVTQRDYSKALKETCPDSPRIVFIPIKFALAAAWLGERLIQLMMKRDLKIHYMFKARDNCAQISAERFRQDFSWESQVSFQEGMKRASCPDQADQ